MSLVHLTKPRSKTISLAALSLIILGPFAACEKKPEAPQATAEAPKEAVISAPAGWVAQADQLGFARHIPSDVSVFVSSVHFKKHLEALKNSQYWKKLGAYLDDQAPAPTSDNKGARALGKLWGDDFFIAGGTDLISTSQTLVELSELHSEISIRTLLAGTNPNSPINLGAAPSAQILQSFISSPGLVDRVLQIAKQLETPPLLVGIKTEDPQKTLNDLLSPESKKELESKKIELSEIKNNKGVTFTVGVWKAESTLTKDKIDQILKSLGDEQPADFKAKVAEILQVLQQKVVKFAVGQHEQYLLLSLFQDAKELDFAEKPENSILSNAKLEKLHKHHGENLITINTIKGELLKALSQEQPFRPYIDGLVGALKETESFAEIGKRLEPQAKELALSEKKVYSANFSDTAIVTWWKDGFHLEAVGGREPKGFDLTTPLQFSDFLNGEKIVFGMNVRALPEYSQDFNTWMEHLASFIYSGAKELTQSGIFGPNVAQQLAMGEMMVIPTWTKIYTNLKDLFLKGLDTESLIVVDMAGKTTNPDAKPEDFPRYFSLYEVKDVSQVKNSWKSIHDTIQGLVTMFGMPNAQAAFTPQSEDFHGMTQWYYPNPALQGDLQPNATINEKHLILSSSKSASKEIAEKLEKKSESSKTGFYYVLNPQSIVEILKTAGAYAPADKQAEVKKVEEVVHWLSPFHTLKGSLRLDGDELKTQLDWDIKDTKSFD